LTHPSADPLVGTTVAHYDILAKIGGGGMGVVYSARDAKLGRTVALKFLPPQWSHDESAKQRFIREAQAASATDHPNICTIHDIAEAGDGRLFLVMAHYEGQTLKQKIEAGPLDVETAIEIAAQVAEGLTKAHAQGIVHRDIKPGNLLVDLKGVVKVLDLGLARFTDGRFSPYSGEYPLNAGVLEMDLEPGSWWLFGATRTWPRPSERRTGSRSIFLPRISSRWLSASSLTILLPLNPPADPIGRFA